MPRSGRAGLIMFSSTGTRACLGTLTVTRVRTLASTRTGGRPRRRHRPLRPPHGRLSQTHRRLRRPLGRQRPRRPSLGCSAEAIGVSADPLRSLADPLWADPPTPWAAPSTPVGATVVNPSKHRNSCRGDLHEHKLGMRCLGTLPASSRDANPRAEAVLCTGAHARTRARRQRAAPLSISGEQPSCANLRHHPVACKRRGEREGGAVEKAATKREAKNDTKPDKPRACGNAGANRAHKDEPCRD